MLVTAWQDADVNAHTQQPRLLVGLSLAIVIVVDYGLSGGTERYSISSPANPTPYAGQTHTYNPSSSSIMDIDISLLAAIGDAMTRGASMEAKQADKTRALVLERSTLP